MSKASKVATEAVSLIFNMLFLLIQSVGVGLGGLNWLEVNWLLIVSRVLDELARPLDIQLTGLLLLLVHQVRADHEGHNFLP